MLKILLTVLILLVLSPNVYADNNGILEPTQSHAESLFFQPFDSVDWALLGGTALADIGDMSTSSDIPNFAANGHPGFHEINPAIDALWNTSIPSQSQYALTFAGIFVLQTVLAYALPEKYFIRKIVMSSFIGIGLVDTGRNLSMGLRFAW